MWGTIMNINSIFWCIGATYLLYALGLGILTWQWKQFWVALLITIFLSLTEIVLAALAE